MSTREFKKFMSTFKPEFGNEIHIRICEIVGRIRQKENLLKQEEEYSKKRKRIIEEIKEEEKLVLGIVKERVK